MSVPAPTPAPRSAGNAGAPLPARSMASVPLSQAVEVETPELVSFSYTLAGLGSRGYAALIDYTVVVVSFFVLGVLAAWLHVGRLMGRTAADAWASAIIVIGLFMLLWGYYVLFEGLWDGQTPGKRIARLRVVRDGGYSITFSASAVRNLLRIVDMQPIVSYLLGAVSIIATKQSKRLGDIVAGTIVVREEVIREAAAPAPRQPAADEVVAVQASLTDPELEVLGRYMDRRMSLDPARRSALAAQLAARLAHAMPAAQGESDTARLAKLYESERAIRARGVAARQATGAARERYAIIAAGSPRWSRFASTLAEAQRTGLAALGEERLRDFVAEYRELSADLARLRTAAQGATEPQIFYLSRLVAGAHNLLYRSRSLGWRGALRFVFVDAPAEVRRSWRPIALAALMLFGPAVIAYTAVVERPEVAGMFLPSQMLDRANAGVDRAKNGDGYIPDPQVFRPVMATTIIANNVQVTYATFAGGLTAGLLTLWLLIANGVSIGGVMGLYASKKIARLLLAFVAPHGVLELSAICIGAAGGLLLASALLMPGLRTRKAALVENGKRAARLLGAATAMLVVAGTLEGFVSPIPWWPLEWKAAVSVLTAVLLYAYLRAPRRRAGAPAAAGASAESSLLSLGGPA